MDVVLWILVLATTLVILWAAMNYIVKRGPQLSPKFLRRIVYRRQGLSNLDHEGSPESSSDPGLYPPRS